LRQANESTNSSNYEIGSFGRLQTSRLRWDMGF